MCLVVVGVLFFFVCWLVSWVVCLGFFLSFFLSLFLSFFQCFFVFKINWEGGRWGWGGVGGGREEGRFMVA